ncbi:hypothetical protein, conserved, partial [Eimeria maxima]
MGEKKRPRDAEEAAADSAAAAAAHSSSTAPQKQQKDGEEQQQQQQEKEEKEVTFASLGLCRELCAAAAAAKWQKPTAVQQQVIPLVLQQLQRLQGVRTVQHRDIIAVASTGSGKTGAFVLPLLQLLLQSSSSRYSSSSSSSSSPFAVILSPTRELALQVFDWVQALTAATAASEKTAAAAAAAAAAIRGCCCAL